MQDIREGFKAPSIFAWPEPYKSDRTRNMYFSATVQDFPTSLLTVTKCNAINVNLHDVFTLMAQLLETAVK